jgi:hypothetical protein
MMKEKGLPFTPILVENPGSVLNGYGFHTLSPYVSRAWVQAGSPRLDARL